MEKGAKIAIGVGSLIAIAIIVYYLFFNKNSPLKIFSDRERLDDLINDEEQGEVTQSNFFNSNTTNPFSSEAEVRAFQKYVVNVKKDTKILGSAGVDGKWGTYTAKAWEKYGKDYTLLNNINGGTSSLESFVNRLDQLGIPKHKVTDDLVQLRFANSATKYAYLVDYNNEGKLNITQVNYSNPSKLETKVLVENATWNINGSKPANQILWKGEVYEDLFYKRPEKPIRKILLELYPDKSDRWANGYKPI